MDVFQFRELRGKEKEEMAEIILKTYIKNGSRHQLNIDSDVRDTIEEQLAATAFPPEDVFDEAMHRIWNLLRDDSFAKFSKSEPFLAWCAAFQAAKSQCSPRRSLFSVSLDADLNSKPCLNFSIKFREAALHKSSLKSCTLSLSNPELPGIADLPKRKNGLKIGSRGRRSSSFDDQAEPPPQDPFIKLCWDYPIQKMSRTEKQTLKRERKRAQHLIGDILIRLNGFL